MGKAESQSKLIPTTHLTEIEANLTELKTKIDDLRGALTSIATDSFRVQTV